MSDRRMACGYCGKRGEVRSYIAPYAPGRVVVANKRNNYRRRDWRPICWPCRRDGEFRVD